MPRSLPIQPDDLQEARRGARAVRARKLENGAPERYRLPSSKGVEAMLVGYLGEIIAGRALGIPDVRCDWTKRTSDLPELATRVPFEVRTTRHRHGHLIVYESNPDGKRGDSPASPYILVIVGNETAAIPGWLWGHEAQNERYWNARARFPAFFVPQSVLRPLSELQAFIA